MRGRITPDKPDKTHQRNVTRQHKQSPSCIDFTNIEEVTAKRKQIER